MCGITVNPTRSQFLNYAITHFDRTTYLSVSPNMNSTRKAAASLFLQPFTPSVWYLLATLIVLSGVEYAITSRQTFVDFAQFIVEIFMKQRRWWENLESEANDFWQIEVFTKEIRLFWSTL